MTKSARKLMLQRLKTARVALADGELRQKSACAFVLKQQVVVNKMVDELILCSTDRELAEVTAGLTSESGR